MSILSIIPKDLKRELLDRIAHSIGEWADEHEHEGIAKSARHLASDHAFLEALDRAWKSGVERFNAEYDDQGMVAAIGSDSDFWKSPTVKAALLKLASHPGAWLEAEQATLTLSQHFDDVLPTYPREQVGRAVGSLLRYIVEALWQLPGAAQVRELYAFQFQKLTAEAVTAQVQIGQAQLAAVQQLGSEMREMVAQLNQLVAQALPGAATPMLPYSWVASLPAPTANNDIMQLYEQMNAHLSEDDLRLLCAYLSQADTRLHDLDRQDLPTGKSAALLDLLDFCKKRDTLPQLRSVLAERFPYALGTGESSPLPTTSQPPYSNLPSFDLANFVGRQKEQEWLRTRLAASHPARQLVVLGIGGAGKSSLAVAVAEDYLHRYRELAEDERFEACVWVSAKEKVLTVEGEEPADFPEAIFHTLDDIYTAIAQTLEREDITRAATPAEQTRLAQKALKNYRTLLIVDNLESIRSEQARTQVKTFLRRLPAPSKAIITTREWTGGEYVLRVGGLSDEDAGEMITHEAAAQGVSITVAERQQLLELTAGLPLPIKLAIARLASDESFVQVVRWLGSKSGYLPEYCVKGQSDLVESRSEGAWKLLLAASLFDREAGASREALGQIAEVSEEERDEELTLLQRLSLLNRSDADRFSMLPIMQSYVGKRLVNSELAEQMTVGWLNWTVKFSISNGLSSKLDPRQISLFQSEYQNLLKAIRQCYKQSRWPLLIQIADGTVVYPYVRGLFSEHREIVEAAIRACEEIKDEKGLATYMRYLARISNLQGHYEDAMENLTKAEEIAKEYNMTSDLAWAWNIRAYVLMSNGQLSEAKELNISVLKLAEQINDSELKSRSAETISMIEAREGHLPSAIEWLNKSEVWAIEAGWFRQLAWIMYRRASYLFLSQQLEVAENLALNSMEQAMEVGERRLIANCKQLLARIYLGAEYFTLARQNAEEAKDLFERIGVAGEVQKMEDILRQLQFTET